jgi:hypothetical protein
MEANATTPKMNLQPLLQDEVNDSRSHVREDRHLFLSRDASANQICESAANRSALADLIG